MRKASERTVIRYEQPGGSLWNALDDRQLTSLLTDSAPRSTTE